MSTQAEVVELPPLREALGRSFVSERDGERTNTVFTVIAVLVALAMFIAASGSGSDQPMGDTTVPGWVDVGGNILAATIGVLVLIPRTRIVGAVAAVINMFVSMYLNYNIDGVDFFVDAIAYNTVTIMLASILVGHYHEDLANLPKLPKPPLP